MGKGFWEGDRVWVVGASSGIGRALSEALAERGAIVVASARNVRALEGFVGDLKSRGLHVRYVPVDVTDTDSVRRAYSSACASTGAVDTLIYCAGDWEPVDLPAIDTERVEMQCQVNYLGMTRCIGEVFGGMARSGKAKIVGVSSASAYLPLPRAAAYGASKSAASYFLRSLRLDAKKLGVSVTVVEPGFVDTPLSRRNDFKMPFLISAQAAARAIIDGLEKGKTEIAPPRRLTAPMAFLGALPRPIQEALVSVIFRR